LNISHLRGVDRKKFFLKSLKLLAKFKKLFFIFVSVEFIQFALYSLTIILFSVLYKRIKPAIWFSSHYFDGLYSNM